MTPKITLSNVPTNKAENGYRANFHQGQNGFNMTGDTPEQALEKLADYMATKGKEREMLQALSELAPDAYDKVREERSIYLNRLIDKERIARYNRSMDLAKRMDEDGFLDRDMRVSAPNTGDVKF